MAAAVREEFAASLSSASAGGREATPNRHSDLRRGAIDAARRAVLTMRASNEIGDDAFHQIEEELDWLEMADRRTE